MKLSSRTLIILVRGFNLYPKFQETENRASGGISILVNENIHQSIVTLNINLQAVAVKVTAHKTLTCFHSESGTFTSIDLTLCSPSLFLYFSWKVGPDPCGSDHFPIILENDGSEM